uniref:Uncharacterized protein n=1 Tax=Callorhinchus milii TaxID=7868 RepID=A0A4W3GFQ5_CALMI
MLRFGQRFRHGSVSVFQPSFPKRVSWLGHVIAPPRLIQMHLLLGVGQEGEVRQRFLLPQVGEASVGPTLEHLQLSGSGHRLGFALLHVLHCLPVRLSLVKLHIFLAWLAHVRLTAFDIGTQRFAHL